MTAQRRELHQRVATLSDNRCLKGALDLWRVRLKERRQVQWRQDMRTRMKTVRDNHDLKLKKDAWAKWRQSHRSHIAEQHFSEKTGVTDILEMAEQAHKTGPPREWG